MKVKLLGLKYVDFVKDDGERLVGTNVFVAPETPANDKTGVGTIPLKKIWIGKDDDISGIKLTDFIGKVIDVEYNDKGKAVYISA